MLAKYLEGVASYIKTKSIYLLLLLYGEGLPADLCGQWFGRIFKQTPNIDHLYLQDIGGRCLVDFDGICLTGMLKLKKLVMRMGLYLVWISKIFPKL